MGKKKSKARGKEAKPDMGGGKKRERPRLDMPLATAVFISGMAFMAMEIIGSRLIQINFGSTVYVWGAIIGVFLLTAALGNVLGGRLADRRPSFSILAALLTGAGLWIALIPFWHEIPGRWMTSSIVLGRGLGAVFLALLLFALPAMFMGATIPFALSLASRQLGRLGDVSGRLYALSNTGSIMGVILSAFLATRYLGNRLTLTLLGLLLLASMLLLALSGRQARTAAAAGEPVRPERMDEAVAGGSAFPVFLLLAVAGAVLMSTQMAGSLILQVYFAATIYVWGSIIAVFMLGMSLGNVLGGRIADRHPRFGSLALLLGLAGCWIISVPTWQQSLQERLVPLPGQALPISPLLGAFVAALCLYGVPSLLIGAVIPCGVRLVTARLERAGRSAGTFLGVFNIGSIVGTLLTSFVLVEFMGHRSILALVGAALVLLTVFTAWIHSPRSGTRGLAYSVLILVLAGLCLWPSVRALDEPGFSPLRPGKGVIRHTMSSPYQRIVIAEDYFGLAFKPPADPETNAAEVYEYTGAATSGARRGLVWTRALCYFNHMAQGQVYVAGGPDSESLPAGLSDGMSGALYTYAFQMACALLPEMRPGRVLVLGGGGLIVPRQFHDAFPPTAGEPGVVIDAVEIDPKVNELAVNQFFPAGRPYDPIYKQRLQLHVEDGRQFLYRQKLTEESGREAPRYDLIIVDVFTAGARIPFHMATREFFERCRSRLTSDGILAMNILGAIHGEKSRLFRSIHKTLSSSPALLSEDEIGIFWAVGAGKSSLEDVENLIVLLETGGKMLEQSRFIDRVDALAEGMAAREGSEYERNEALATAGWLRLFAR